MPDSPHDPPAGLLLPQPTGVRFWVVGLATAMAVLLYLDRFCLSFAERFIKADLNLDNEQTSIMLAAFSVTYALGQVPSGWLSDRFGARRMLTVYIVMWSVCTGLVGVAGTFAAILLLRFGVGLGQAGAYPTSANLLSKWVPFAARGQASGIVSTGGRIGAVAAPILTAYLVDRVFQQYFGSEAWRPTMIAYGVAGLGVAAVFWFVVRDQPADHAACNAVERDLIEKGRLPDRVGPEGKAQGLPLRAMFANASLWCSSLSQFFTNFAWGFLMFHLFPRYLVEVHSVPTMQRGLMVGTPIFVGMFGMLAGGWVTDRLTRRVGLRWGRSLPLVFSRFAAMSAFIAAALLDAPWPVTLALSVVAISTDLGTPSTWAFMQDVGGKHVGSVLGWGNMWGNFGAALSPVVLNEVIGEGGRWPACFLTCAAAYLLSGLCSLGVDARRPIVPPEDVKRAFRTEEETIGEALASPDDRIQVRDERIQQRD
jgi:ACS family glucarate transporter-like MFS transporter